MLKRNLLMSLVLCILIISGILISNYLKLNAVRNEINAYIDKQMKSKTVYIESYDLQGKYSNILSMTFSDEFDKLTLQAQYSELKSLMDGYEVKVKDVLSKYNLYVKALKDSYDTRFIVNTSQNNYEYNFIDSFEVNGKIYSEDQIRYANTPIFNPASKTVISASYELEPTDEEKAFAWTAALQEIKGLLKAPRTAKFPFSYLNEYIKEVAPNTFVVKSYVDAKNSFDAEIRTYFTVKIKKTGENSYKVLDIKMD